MGITHVVRGEVSLAALIELTCPLMQSKNGYTPSIPKLVYVAPTRFAYLSLLLNPDGSKMSKQKGDVDVMGFMVYLIMIVLIFLWKR